MRRGMRVAPSDTNHAGGTSRGSRLAFGLSLIVVAAIIVCAFAIFPEEASALETIHIPAGDQVAPQEADSSAAQQENVAQHTSHMEKMLKNYEKTTSHIASKYARRIEKVVAADQVKNEEDGGDDKDAKHKDRSPSQSHHRHSSGSESLELELLQKESVESVLAELEQTLHKFKVKAPPSEGAPPELLTISESASSTDEPAAVPDQAAAAEAAKAASDAAAAEAEKDAEAAKEAAETKAKAEKAKAKAKEKLKLKALEQKKKEEVERTKERKEKEVAGGVRLKHTGMQHLRNVIFRGGNRVDRRFMRAQRQVYKTVSKSVHRMEQAPAAEAARTKARVLRASGQKQDREYRAWRAGQDADFSKRVEADKERDIRHKFKTAYNDMDASDAYHDAVQRVQDEGVAALAHKLMAAKPAETTKAAPADSTDVAESAAPTAADTAATVASASDDEDSKQEEMNSSEEKDEDSKLEEAPQVQSAAQAASDAAQASEQASEMASQQHAAPQDGEAAAVEEASEQDASVTSDGTPPIDEREKEALQAQFDAMMTSLTAVPQPGEAAQAPSYTPPAEQREEHQVHARAAPNGAVGGVHVDAKLVKAEEDAEGRPNDFNPVDPPSKGKPKPEPKALQADAKTAPSPKDSEDGVQGEHQFRGSPERGALVKPLHDFELKRSKEQMDAHLDKEFADERKAREAKHSTELAAWHTAQRAASKRAVPLAQAVAEKHKAAHWKQVWGAYENRKQLGAPSAREREHLVHPDEPRTGNMGAQGVPRVKGAVSNEYPPAAQPEAKPEAKSDAKPEAKPKARPDAKPEVKDNNKNKKAKAVKMINAGLFSSTQKEKEESPEDATTSAISKHVHIFLNPNVKRALPRTVAFGKFQAELITEKKLRAELEKVRQANKDMAHSYLKFKANNKQLAAILKKNHIEIDPHLVA